jgi:hypothetical protein
MRKNAHCVRLSERRTRHGFGAASMGGLRLLSRVARYRLDDMVPSWGGGALLLIFPISWPPVMKLKRDQGGKEEGRDGGFGGSIKFQLAEASVPFLLDQWCAKRPGTDRC